MTNIKKLNLSFCIAVNLALLNNVVLVFVMCLGVPKQEPKNIDKINNENRVGSTIVKFKV